MIRAALCGLLAALTLGLGLATAIVQAENHERGQALNALKEECNMIEAVNGDRAERILAIDWGPLQLKAAESGDTALEAHARRSEAGAKAQPSVAANDARSAP